MKRNHKSYTMHTITLFFFRKIFLKSHTAHINRNMYLRNITQLTTITHQLASNKKLDVLARPLKGSESKRD